MTAKDVQFHDNARQRIVAGVNILPDAVKVTLGPEGTQRAARAQLQRAELPLRHHGEQRGAWRHPHADPCGVDPRSREAAPAHQPDPARAYGEPEEIAAAVAFVASCDADDVMGNSFVAECGLLWSYRQQ
ncbi:hypothetical protein [Variovorax sp. RCC_210]|uniref:hypothetical protein n=1 Tax=Variovorax sp. RCC_210 TaxID=3239217 RepID=UPI0035269DD2